MTHLRRKEKKTGKRSPLGCSDLAELRVLTLAGTQSKQRPMKATTAMVCERAPQRGRREAVEWERWLGMSGANLIMEIQIWKIPWARKP